MASLYYSINERDNVEEILNLQPKRSKAKPYQVRQVRTVIVHYKLTLEKPDARQI